MLAPLHPILRAATGVGAHGGYTAHVGPVSCKMLRLLSDKSPAELREFA